MMRRTHYLVSQGKIVRHPETDEPLDDDGFKLACHDRLLRLEERRARMLGMDAPQRAKIEVLTKDRFDEALDLATAERDAVDRQLAGEVLTPRPTIVRPGPSEPDPSLALP